METIAPGLSDNVMEQDIYSDVQIEFGYGAMTKADEIDDFLSSEIRYFGLFTVLKGADDVSDKGKLKIPDNRTLRYEPGTGFKFGYQSEPIENQSYLYPKGDDEYSFYAYYSYVGHSRIKELKDTLYLEDDSYEITRSKVYLHMSKENDLSASGPILWAKAKAKDDDTIDGFNANIIRDGHHPYFSFRHPMAKVFFSVSLANPVSKSMDDGVWLQLDELAFVNSPSEADLCLIDTKGQLEGCFENLTYPDVKRDYWYGGNINDEIKADMNKMSFVKGEAGNRNISCRLVAGDHEQKQIGSVLIPPRAAGNPLVCRMRFRYGIGSSISGYQNYDVELDPADYGYDGGYEAGVEYRYNIIVDYRSIPAHDGKIYGVNGPYVRGKWLNENQYSKRQEPTE